jgi:hypothetical protein
MAAPTGAAVATPTVAPSELESPPPTKPGADAPGSGVSTFLSRRGQQKAGTGVLEVNFFEDFRMIDGFLAQ